MTQAEKGQNEILRCHGKHHNISTNTLINLDKKKKVVSFQSLMTELEINPPTDGSTLCPLPMNIRRLKSHVWIYLNK